MSQLKKSLILSALILVVTIPASAMLGNLKTGDSSSSVLRISGNTVPLTKILGGV